MEFKTYINENGRKVRILLGKELTTFVDVPTLGANGYDRDVNWFEYNPSTMIKKLEWERLTPINDFLDVEIANRFIDIWTKLKLERGLTTFMTNNKLTYKTYVEVYEKLIKFNKSKDTRIIKFIELYEKYEGKQKMAYKLEQYSDSEKEVILKEFAEVRDKYIKMKALMKIVPDLSTYNTCKRIYKRYIGGLAINDRDINIASSFNRCVRDGYEFSLYNNEFKKFRLINERSIIKRFNDMFGDGTYKKYVKWHTNEFLSEYNKHARKKELYKLINQQTELNLNAIKRLKTKLASWYVLKLNDVKMVKKFLKLWNAK